VHARCCEIWGPVEIVNLGSVADVRAVGGSRSLAVRISESMCTLVYCVVSVLYVRVSMMRLARVQRY
jgi:hypothetical protein